MSAKTIHIKSQRRTLLNTPTIVAASKIPIDYYLMFCICAIIVAVAFVLSPPQEILRGLLAINTSRSVLITDYVALGGVGAALLNSAMMFFLATCLLVFTKNKPNGRIIAALFLTIGFSLFGKNLFNSLPIIGGVWLYGKASKTKFRDLIVQAMISSTIAPIVSHVAFYYDYFSLERLLVGYSLGLFVGFVFPVVLEKTHPIHNNFCLYKGGIAGGFIATMFAGLFRSFGLEITPEYIWSTDYTFQLAFLAYAIAAVLILFGVLSYKSKIVIQKLTSLSNERNENDNDFLLKYGNTAYLNIGLMCALATTVMLFLNKPINGPILGGIFTISGFAASGKHLKNTIPILIGSIIASHINFLDIDDPTNALAILFSTGLAPIAGRFGWRWGIITGFIHVSIAIFIGDINGGLNLYNNGFAGAFVAIIVVPLIIFLNDNFKKARKAISHELFD